MVGRREFVCVLALMMLLASFVSGCNSGGDTPSPKEPTSSSTVVPIISQGDITVLSRSTKTDFPKSLTFNLEVESDGQITGVELRYKIAKVTSPSVIATIKPDFTPGYRVKTSWVWDMKKASLPPGAEVEYHWVIKNASGVVSTLTAEKLSFDDTRYDWRELLENNVRLFWHQGDKSFGQALMNAAQGALDKLAEDTGALLEKEVKIYIYASADELQNALVYSQDWTGGIAFTDYGIIAIGVSPGNLDWGKGTVAHELAHLVISQVTFNPYAGLPTWLSEGLAMYAEGELTENFEELFTGAVFNSALISVQSLSSSFPADAGEALLAYAESYQLVKFIIDSYGADKMLDLLHVFRNGSSPDDALLAVYGFDTNGLDSVWRLSLGIGAPLASGFRRGLPGMALCFTFSHLPTPASL
ncbi:MAG: peptidase MA family metallohydrolase [Dehalococcoidia bacterium]|nr:peptidase MA family metallohydrolase [Dehalococcoidia bacterium]